VKYVPFPVEMLIDRAPYSSLICKTHPGHGDARLKSEDLVESHGYTM